MGEKRKVIFLLLLDVDAYVVDKSLDSLFYTVAEEEKKICRDRQRA